MNFYKNERQQPGADAEAHLHPNWQEKLLFPDANVSIVPFRANRAVSAGSTNTAWEFSGKPDKKKHKKARWRSLYLLFLEFAEWSSSNSPRLHVQKVAAPRRPHGAAPWVPPLSTALPRSSPTCLCLWARLRHFALLLSTFCGGESSPPNPWHLLCAVPIKADTQQTITGSHAWDGMLRARRVDHSLFIYFIHTQGVDGGQSAPAYWTAPLLSPVLALN